MSGRIPPALDGAFTRRVLASALAATLEASGRSGWVVGLSGGIDSALAATLAVDASGADRVRALFLPGPATSAASRDAARATAERLGLELETVPLGPALEAAPVPADDAVRRGNFVTRLRMAVLYDRAAAREALVVGTSNKTEIVLGYTTLWGDMAADVWPLGDLYKTQVLDLARSAGISAEVVERPPTAELWEGQTDEEELGFSYDAADRVLYTYLESRRRPDEIPDLLGDVPGRTVERVLARVRAGAFKRRLPHAPKLSVRTVGLDFIHPRAWGGPA